MLRPTQIAIPTLVRVKEGALDRLGVYLRRDGCRAVAVLVSKGLQSPIPDRAANSLKAEGIEPVAWIEVSDNDIESSARLFAELPGNVSAVVGVGGGKALDVAKYVGFLGRLPYYAVPTSLSNDGFCSPQSSLTIRGKRRSLPAALPFGVIIDTAVCLNAPRVLALSGVGDLVAKFTAVRDWKLAFHQTGEPVNDFAALLSDGSIHAYLSHPSFDLEGIRLLATALMLNGISMEICGSSRPASGSEHLISHALDAMSARPRLHGLQVGIATYIVSVLQGVNTDRIAELFDAIGFWIAIAEDPFSRAEWLAAVRAAPTIKEGFYTILSSRDVLPEVERIVTQAPRLKECFRD
ncbi:MAG: iron-containing alcohol dehydrogenase family protein [Planctomycetaceae bacterium]|nr:iron-containing alcohol dehydrogenase family protein [Planctomycetaceae bacterium]